MLVCIIIIMESCVADSRNASRCEIYKEKDLTFRQRHK